jgi:hypothetical protein
LEQQTLYNTTIACSATEAKKDEFRKMRNELTLFLIQKNFIPLLFTGQVTINFNSGGIRDITKTENYR